MHCTLQGARYNRALTDLTNVREVGFKLRYNTRKIGVDRAWVDMMGHIGDVKRKGVNRRFWIKTMKGAESKIRVERQRVSERGGFVDGKSERNGTVNNELLQSPRLPCRLPGLKPGMNHFWAAPSDGRGG